MSSAHPVLISKQRIADRVQALGNEISSLYQNLLPHDEPLMVVSVLSGGFIFTADLVRKLELPCLVDFIQVQSYEGTESTGAVQFIKDCKYDMKGKHCLIVEDIVDTGMTADALLKEFGKREPASLRLCSLLHKPSREKVKVPIDFIGFTIEDHFVVGYGLDVDGRFRNKQDILIYQGA